MVKPLPQDVKKTQVEVSVPVMRGKSSDQIKDEFDAEIKRNFGPTEIEGLDETVEKTMRSEFKKSAKEANKKPISTYLKK